MTDLSDAMNQIRDMPRSTKIADVPRTETEVRYLVMLDNIVETCDEIALDAPETVDNDQIMAEIMSLQSHVFNLRMNYR